jgi:hypothetical protein
LDRINRIYRISKRLGHRPTQTKTDTLTRPAEGGTRATEIHREKPLLSQKPRAAGLPVPKLREMGGTIPRIARAGFSYSLDWIRLIAFERGSRHNRSSLNFSTPLFE